MLIFQDIFQSYQMNQSFLLSWEKRLLNYIFFVQKLKQAFFQKNLFYWTEFNHKNANLVLTVEHCFFIVLSKSSALRKYNLLFYYKLKTKLQKKI